MNKENRYYVLVMIVIMLLFLFWWFSLSAIDMAFLFFGVPLITYAIIFWWDIVQYFIES